MLIDRETGKRQLEKAVIPYPDNPRIIRLGESGEFIEADKFGGFEVIEYVCGNEAYEKMARLAQEIPFEDYDNVIVNLNGGDMPFQMLRALSAANIKNIVKVEYHRSKGGYSAEIVTPIPEKIRNEKNIIVDDILDSGGVLQAMIKDSPNSDIVVAVTKVGVPNQVPVYKETAVYTGIVIYDKWGGGMGMNLGPGYPNDFPRNHVGIIVKKDK